MRGTLHGEIVHCGIVGTFHIFGSVDPLFAHGHRANIMGPHWTGPCPAEDEPFGKIMLCVFLFLLSVESIVLVTSEGFKFVEAFCVMMHIK